MGGRRGRSMVKPMVKSMNEQDAIDLFIYLFYFMVPASTPARIRIRCTEVQAEGHKPRSWTPHLHSEANTSATLDGTTRCQATIYSAHFPPFPTAILYLLAYTLVDYCSGMWFSAVLYSHIPPDHSALLPHRLFHWHSTIGISAHSDWPQCVLDGRLSRMSVPLIASIFLHTQAGANVVV